MVKVKDLTVSAKGTEKPEKSIFAALSFCDIYIPLDGVIDLNDQIKRIEKNMIYKNLP